MQINLFFFLILCSHSSTSHHTFALHIPSTIWNVYHKTIVLVACMCSPPACTGGAQYSVHCSTTQQALKHLKNSVFECFLASSFCTVIYNPDRKRVCRCCGIAFLSHYLLHSPLLFPVVTQESDRGSGPKLARTPALLALGGYLEAPRSLLLGLLAASPPLSLAALANWNLISWAPVLACFCQLDQRIALLGRTGWILRIPQELYAICVQASDSESSLLFCTESPC